ncbi:MAG: UDP-N-acetylglucosamine 4,6-dehydratase (inverting) [Gemmatimonadaceae bacterium]|nr:UDP-N-acetylglucosamine 4,6-dehydratase (inverting) [Gemmatimonadaceae bacterium]
MLNGKTVLITGGTGSFGQRFTEIVLRNYSPKRLIVFSRDELKQSEMHMRFGEEEYPSIRYFIGDVRDRDRLHRAFDGVDIVVHAAALKQVLAAEYNPIEAVKTNVLGAANVIDAAIDRGVAKVIALSTDKAASPVSLYGATKLCSDKLVVAANSYSGTHQTRFSVVRYGNVLGSRGSVVPLFLQQRHTGKLSITDPRMTRFWITLDQGVNFVLSCLDHMFGGEIFVPKIPSMKLIDLARAIGPQCDLEIVGRRPGEKLHELMVGEDDAQNTLEYDDYYAILPTLRIWNRDEVSGRNGGRPCPEGFRYSSETNDRWLSAAELEQMIGQGKPALR